jgi:hypothetical protein
MIPSPQSKSIAQSIPIIAAGKLARIAKYIPSTAHNRPASEQMLGRSLTKESIVGC